MKKIKNVINKYQKVYLIVIGFLLVLTLGISFAYFATGVSDPAHTLVTLVSDGVNKLEFHPGEELVFTDGELYGETNPYAISEVHNPADTFTSTYNIYLDVKDNQFKYTTADETGELLLKVYNPNGTELKNITGLDYITVEGVSGFDITELNSLYPLVNDYEIVSTGDTPTRQDWTFEIHYIDLVNNQVPNNDKYFKAEILFQGLDEKEVFATSILEKNRGKTIVDLKKDPDFANGSTSRDYYYSLDTLNRLKYDYDYGLYPSTDNYGESYYFRGAVNNNWVYFADSYWRIVRINGDNSVRMIYAGKTAPSASQSVVKTGTDMAVGTSSFNSGSLAEHTGYVYEEGVLHGITSSSNIKTYLDNWYVANLTSYEDFLADTGYCADRTIYSGLANNTIYNGTGIGDSNTFFGAAGRLVNYGTFTSIGNPSLMCNQSDLLTTDDDVNGTIALTNKIGLISADEVMMAGVNPGLSNAYSYLYIAQDFYTMTPYIGGGNESVFIVNSSGQIGSSTITTSEYIRPVINVKADTMSTGTGHFDNPYILER